MANGSHGSLGLSTQDCRRAYAELTAKGVDFVQPPSEAGLRGRSGVPGQFRHWLVLVEPREFDPATAAAAASGAEL